MTDIIKPYYRLEMLNTLVHEIAHHDDLMRRTGRGRWLMLNEDKSEDYAAIKEAEWTKEIVVPYLLETYAEEYSKLSQWIKDNGGTNLHLSEERVIIPVIAISKSVINKVGLEYELNNYEKSFMEDLRRDDLV